ncbi:MAG: hypothetical protein H0X66_21280 [Verrucomicrobia bacterium]|nr:hypothetical protein [Verrucomicrobiota bacterium]
MVYALTIFLSAFLLFLVQLIIGKRILPWFGGAPAVWTTCMLFFQLLLLAGYAYAHFLSARFSKTLQARIHGTILLASLVVLGALWWQWGTPILPGENWKPVSPENPAWQILKLLSVSVGVPFFLLSSTSPLLQRWYSFQADRTQTYRLYALSNAGSMLGLLSYPVLIEPWSRLGWQGVGWGVFYVVFVIGCLACARRLAKSPDRVEEASSSRKIHVVGVGRIIQWLLLATATSAMLLAVTNNLCQEVAVVPFLWVLPLSLYLLSFIICFDSPRWYQRRWFVLALTVSSLVVLVTTFKGIHLPIVTHVFAYGAFLFLFCMTCHGELVALKPESSQLTLFYLMVALGGAFGGIFVGLLAPMLFSGYWEFHLVLLAGWIVLTWVFAQDKRSFFYTGDRVYLWVMFAVATYLFVRVAFQFRFVAETFLPYVDITYTSLILALGLAALLASFTIRRNFGQSKYWPRIMVGSVIFIAECFMLNRTRSTGPGTLDANRNFYGVTRVEQREAVERKLSLVQLSHGQIIHGIQFLDEELRGNPVGYYSTNSGIGRAFQFHPRRTGPEHQAMNIGVLGLGVGTLAAFGRPSDQIRFYEINPVVIHYSLGERPFFTYLKESAATVEVVAGDARLTMERELATGRLNQFDILAMDAFSSDSVPTHLLTSEAFEVYLGHLRDKESILAINISNRFLDFRDLMLSMAKKFGMKVAIVSCRGDWPDRTPSLWCLMSRGQVAGSSWLHKQHGSLATE